MKREVWRDRLIIGFILWQGVKFVTIIHAMRRRRKALARQFEIMAGGSS